MPLVFVDYAYSLLTVSKGHVVLPKSVTNSRIEENLKIIKLDSSDMEALEGIHKAKGITRFVYPAFGVSLGSPITYTWFILTARRSHLAFPIRKNRRLLLRAHFRLSVPCEYLVLASPAEARDC